MEDINHRLEKIEKDLGRITEALLGNEFNKAGVIHSIAEHKMILVHLEKELKRVDEKHEKRFNMVKWIIVGLSLASGFGISELVNILMK